jgi:predicted ester cyclase
VDKHFDSHDVIAQRDEVVLRFTNSGTNIGPFMNTPPTDNRAEWLGIGIYTVHDAKITEAWFAEDILGMMLQLGAISLPSLEA